MLGINGQMKNFNAKCTKIFFILLKIFLRSTEALRSPKIMYWKISIYDESRNRDSSGNPFLWLGMFNQM